MDACLYSTVLSGVAHLTHMAPPPPSPPCLPAPPPRPGPALLFRRPRPDAALVGLSSLPGPTPTHPLHTWVPCGLVSGLAPQRCSEPSADWPGPVGRGMISIEKGGSTLPARLTWGEGRSGHPPGQRVSQSCLLHVCGEIGHQKGRTGRPPARSHLPAFAYTMPSAEHIVPSRLLLGVSYWSLGSRHLTLP